MIRIVFWAEAPFITLAKLWIVWSMKVILLAGFGFDSLLNDDFSLQDQCIIQCKSDENWKRSSPTPKVSFPA